MLGILYIYIWFLEGLYRGTYWVIVRDPLYVSPVSLTSWAVRPVGGSKSHAWTGDAVRCNGFRV